MRTLLLMIATVSLMVIALVQVSSYELEKDYLEIPTCPEPEEKTKEWTA